MCSTYLYPSRCVGLPDGPCPKNRHDKSVKNGTGDLMLCPDCDRIRFQQNAALRQQSDQSAYNVCGDVLPTVNSAAAGVVASSSARDKSQHIQHAVPDDRGDIAVRGPISTPKPSVNGNGSDVLVPATDTEPRVDTKGVSGSAPSASQRDKRRGKKNPQSASNETCLQPVYSELLQYVNYHRDRSTHDLLRKVVLSFFTPNEIAEAKRCLVNEFSTELHGCASLTDRRKSSIRSVQEAELDDIIGILDDLDSKELLDKRVFFAAVHWDRIPKYGPEELNTYAVVERQLQLEAKVASLAEAVSVKPTADSDAADHDTLSSLSVETLKASIADIDNKVVNFNQNITSQITQLTSVCQQLSASVSQSVPTTVTTTISSKPTIDRSLNSVVFGLSESRDSLTWREELFKVLHHAAGRDVIVADALRLGGRYVDGKTRPVLVKFQSVWDRRLVLSGARKLGDKPEYRGVYVKPDETVEERRRATLKRLHSRAVRDGKDCQLQENGSILYIDNVLFFSLKEGFVRANVQLPSSSDGAGQQ